MRGFFSWLAPVRRLGLGLFFLAVLGVVGELATRWVGAPCSSCSWMWVLALSSSPQYTVLSVASDKWS
jgi:hypothetical protein